MRYWETLVIVFSWVHLETFTLLGRKWLHCKCFSWGEKSTRENDAISNSKQIFAYIYTHSYKSLQDNSKMLVITFLIEIPKKTIEYDLDIDV
jgi:hypothetical protein